LAAVDSQKLIDFEEDRDELIAESESKPSALEDLAEIAYINDATAVAMFKHLNNEKDDGASSFLEQVEQVLNKVESASRDNFSSMVGGTYCCTLRLFTNPDTFISPDYANADSKIAADTIVTQFMGISEIFQGLPERVQRNHVIEMSKKLVAIALSAQATLESEAEAARTTIEPESTYL
jgi:hypothetical protein